MAEEMTILQEVRQLGEAVKCMKEAQTVMNSTGLPIIGFPKFSGVDLSDWQFKCEQFFDLYKTSADAKVGLASLHMEGEALKWCKALPKQRKSSWEDYIRELEMEFGDKSHGSEQKKQEKCTQTGEISDPPKERAPENQFPDFGLPLIEFPKFSGVGLSDWQFKCEQFFALYKTSADAKVGLALIHMEGKALKWSRAVLKEKKLSWEDYVFKMKQIFRDKTHGRQPGQKATQSDAISTKPRRRRICEVISDDQPRGLLFRFGPLYNKDLFRDSDGRAILSLDGKEEAWQHLLKSSPDRAATTMEKYMSAMRNIEEEARASYKDGSGMVDISGPDFRWMMIKDGCFFLQLALHVLGDAQPYLGYPLDHKIFGQRNYHYKDFKDWFEAMFFVGNQVPLVVLNKLMKQNYFQQVIEKGKWEQPSDLCRLALYELLLLPAQQVGFRQQFFRKVFASRSHWLQREQPCDLLHGLQLLILGPKGDEGIEEEEEEEEEEKEKERDLEAQQELTNRQDDHKTWFSATEFKKAGVHFWPLNGIKGSRGIHFTNSMWSCKAFPILHLPPFLVGDDTELILRSVRDYEMCQNLDKSKQEVSSYLWFMSELIRTSDDAKLMYSKGIIQGKHPKYRLKLPDILRSLAPKESSDRNLSRVKLETSEYSLPPWTQYWHIVSIALIVTILQTIYTILPYYKSS